MPRLLLMLFVSQVLWTQNVQNHPQPAKQEVLNSLDKAREYYRARDYLQALVQFKKALVQRSETAELYLPIGVCLYHLKRYNHACETLQAGLGLSDKQQLNSKLRTWLVRSCLREGDRLEKRMLWTQAIGQWKQALEHAESQTQIQRLKHRMQQAWFAKGAYHFSLEHHLKAALAFSEILLDNPEKELVKRIRRMGVNLFLNAARWCRDHEMAIKAEKLYRSIQLHFAGYRTAHQEALDYLDGERQSPEKLRSLWEMD